MKLLALESFCIGNGVDVDRGQVYSRGDVQGREDIVMGRAVVLDDSTPVTSVGAAIDYMPGFDSGGSYPALNYSAANISTGPLIYPDAAWTAASAALPARFFPANNIWNRDISTMPVHASSATWVATTCDTGCVGLHPGWYPNLWGMRYNIVDGDTPGHLIRKTGTQYPGSHDGLVSAFPFTKDTLLQLGTPDSEAFMIWPSENKLWEMYNAHWNNGDPSANACVIWDLTINNLRSTGGRPQGISSADEAGLPIFPGLCRWDEVLSGSINHALRFECEHGHIDPGTFLWPARHAASNVVNGDDGHTSKPSAPPMGARARLRADYNISTFRAQTQVILLALKKYGMFLADHGEDWDMTGTADGAWNKSVINDLFKVPISAFDFIDESSLIIDPDSAECVQP